jgi:hypothetical protein
MSRFLPTNAQKLGWYLIGVTFLGVHLFPFAYFKQVLVLGYDTGLYRRYLLEPFTGIPHMAVPGLDHTVIIPRIWLDLFRVSGLSTDTVLYGSYIAACAFCLAGFFFLVRSRSTTAVAQLAVLFVLLAPVYYLGYWFFLYKNILALGLLFWLLYGMERKQYTLVLLLAVLIPITHQSTTVFVGVLFAALALRNWYQGDRTAAKRYAFLWGVLTVMYLVYHPNVAAKISAPPTAVFLPLQEFVILTCPLFLVLLLRIRAVFDVVKTETVLTTALGLLGIWMVGDLPYADRMGFFAIFFIGALVARVIPVVSRLRMWVLLFLCAYGIYGVYYMTQRQPHFDRVTELHLQTLVSVPPGASVVTPPYVATWVQGYTTAAVYAPGLFKDAASPMDWEYYWSHESAAYDEAFLGSFPQPLYLFVPKHDQNRFLPEAKCIEQLDDFLFRYTCGVK